MRESAFLVFGIICALIGIVVLAVKLRLRIRCSRRTDAVIINLQADYTMLRGTKVYTYCPEFSYTVDGKEYQGIAPFSTSKKDKYRIGDPLPVYINPADPEDYDFRGKPGLVIAGVLLLGVGLLFVILNFM